MRNELYARNTKTIRYGTETIYFLPPKIWTLMPQNIKDVSSFTCSKKSIRKWKSNNENYSYIICFGISFAFQYLLTVHINWLYIML